MHAEVAQSVEQRTENPRVRSSILRLGIFYVKCMVNLFLKLVNTYLGAGVAQW